MTARVLYWCPCRRRSPLVCGGLTAGSICTWCAQVCQRGYEPMRPQRNSPHERKRRTSGIRQAPVKRSKVRA